MTHGVGLSKNKLIIMKRNLPMLIASLALLTGCAEHPSPQAEAVAPSPYAGQEDQTIKSLDAATIAAYQAGEGMGLAKAAELNHYPGPKHVLELADSLHLTADQRTATQVSFDAMKERAVVLGTEIVEQEARLDALFAEATATPETLHEALLHLGTLQAELRFVHLNAHLEMKNILRPEQVQHYDALRGYGDGAPMNHSKHHTM